MRKAGLGVKVRDCPYRRALGDVVLGVAMGTSFSPSGLLAWITRA
jgi:hypothetical protein